MDEQPITIEEALMKKKRKWPTILVVLVVAVLVGGLTYYFVNKKATTDKNNLQTQIDDLNKKIATTTGATSAGTATSATTDPTAGWKTYTSLSKHFSVKYPTDWVVTEQKDQNRVYFGNIAYSSSGEPSDRPANFEQVWISYDPTETAATQENLLKSGKSDCCELTGSITKSSINALTAGLSIDSYEYNTVGGSKLEAFWANNVAERFKATNSTEIGVTNQTNMVTQLKKMLGSFQFTD